MKSPGDSGNHFRLPWAPGDLGKNTDIVPMGNFEEISRQLRYTFAELESAQGTVKRRWLRKAHLLLLLADEMIADAEAQAPINDTPSATDRQFNAVDARTFLQAFAENAVHSTERGTCRGLQTVLVLRQH